MDIRDTERTNRIERQSEHPARSSSSKSRTVNGERTVHQKTSQRKPAQKRGSSGKKKKSTQGFNLINRNPICVIAAAICVFLLAVAGVGYAVWYNSFIEISLSDYILLNLNGYDRHGKANVSVKDVPEYRELFDTVEANLDVDENLCNGDEITISFKYDENIAKDSKVRIEADDVKIVVDGLLEAEVISNEDVFSGLKIDIDGIAPCVKVKLENTNDKTPYSNILYTVEEEKGGYDCGDEIKIKALVSEEDINNPAYEFELDDATGYVKTITIPQGDRYLTDPSEVTDAMISELEEVGYSLISKADANEYGLRIFLGETRLTPVFVGTKTTFQWRNPYILSAYFHNVTEEGKKLPESHANDVQIVYGVTITQADGTSVLTEMVIQFTNLLKHEDGTVDLNLDSGRIVSASYKDANIKALVNDEEDGTYVTTKITE